VVLLQVDCADSQPCFGTCGMQTWTLKVHGKIFHSGLPHRVRPTHWTEASGTGGWW
jgi:hypothetical protein